MATQTATTIAQLDQAGAIDCGRLVSVEYALGVTGHNAYAGTPKIHGTVTMFVAAHPLVRLRLWRLVLSLARWAVILVGQSACQRRPVVWLVLNQHKGWSHARVFSRFLPLWIRLARLPVP